MRRYLADLCDPVFDLVHSRGGGHGKGHKLQYFSAPKIAMQQDGFRDQPSPTMGWPDTQTLTTTYDVSILPVLLENREYEGRNAKAK